MRDRVIVPLAGSPAAEAILPSVLQIAGPLDFEVILLRVVPRLAPPFLARSRRVRTNRARGVRLGAELYLAAVAGELRATGVDCDTRTRRGRPEEEIVAVARETGARCIAMTTRGRRGLGRLLHASVTEAVLRRADVPVFVTRVRDGDPARKAAPGPATRVAAP
jgi:nucleotide-binding universal stress UspA family protein